MMKRRTFLKFSAVAIASGLAAPKLHAQGAWPTRPVRLILPYAPGGATDLIGRPWSDKLAEAFGQPFVIEHRGGASGMIGLEAAAKSPPDGYTFVLTPSAPLTILPTLRKTPYEPTTSFMPVARVGDIISGFVIHPSVGVKTFNEMLDHARKNPGKLSYGSAGLGTSTHMRLEMLKLRANVDILHVPYRGSADSLERSPGRQHSDDERDQPAAACEGGQADPFEHQLAEALARLAGRADADRAWLSGFGCAGLVLDLRAGGNACRHRADS